MRQHVADAVGATVLIGGDVPSGVEYDGGSYFTPTVLADVREGMRVMTEETFGPVAPLIRFETESEAYGRANDSRYGLAAYVFTENLSRALRAAERLEYGIVGVNEGSPSTSHS